MLACPSGCAQARAFRRVCSEILVPLRAIVFDFLIIKLVGHIVPEVLQIRQLLPAPLRLVGRRQLARLECVPVQAVEPGVGPEQLLAVGQHGHALGGVVGQDCAEEVLRGLREDARPLAGGVAEVSQDLPGKQPMQYLSSKLGLEGSLACQELPDDDAQCPPVHRDGVADLPGGLRSQIAGRAAHGVGLADDELGEAHVRQLQPALRIQQHILWLQIPVDDVPLMQMRQRTDKTGSVELRVLLLPEELFVPVDGV
mmetsp:Transcript_83309/g.244254  ORF Transcript_83309/g.244254 Transcript_83309/m.244254 type:complete len:255 (-) Transcript_83309:2138-2902(-)